MEGRKGPWAKQRKQWFWQHTHWFHFNNICFPHNVTKNMCRHYSVQVSGRVNPGETPVWELGDGSRTAHFEVLGSPGPLGLSPSCPCGQVCNSSTFTWILPWFLLGQSVCWTLWLRALDATGRPHQSQRQLVRHTFHIHLSFPTVCSVDLGCRTKCKGSLAETI